MSVFNLALNLLGTAYRVLIRAPYTHNKRIFSAMRCVSIYLRLFLLIYTFNPDFSMKCEYYEQIKPVKEFFFPYYSLLSLFSLDYQQSFAFLLCVHVLNIVAFVIARWAWSGLVKLKFSFYLMEVVMPDIFMFLIYNYIGLTPFDSYFKTLGFFLTISLYSTICIGGPIIIIHDREEYKNAIMMQTGLKPIRKYWHYIIKIQELVFLLNNLFCYLWFSEKEIIRQVITSIMIFIFMRLQKTYWAFSYREDNLFLENSYLVLLIVNFVGFNHYSFGLLLMPFFSYLRGTRTKIE